MTHTPFSTPTADYEFVYETHSMGAINSEIFNDENIGGLDAIILENGGTEPRKKSTDSFFKHPYENIIKSAHKSNKPLYLIDVDPETDAFNTVFAHLMFVLPGTIGACLGISAIKDARHWPEKKHSRRDFLKTGLKAAASAYLLSGYYGLFMPALTEGESPEVIETIAATSQRIPPTPFVEFRNCVVARKTEEFLVPLIREYRGRKPKIAIVFGAGHGGMEGCLQHKWWRDAVLRFYEYGNYCGIKKDDLNRVWELLPVDSTPDVTLFGLDWGINEYNSNLF